MIKKIIVISVLLIAISGVSISAVEAYEKEISELKTALINSGVDKEWLEAGFSLDQFKIYPEIATLFGRMAENRVKNKEKDFEWYKNHFGLDLKSRLGKGFLEKHKEALDAAEVRNGIHRELVAAIIGMETNYGDKLYIGRFGVFNALASQYVLMEKRQKFALNELIALYRFSRQINRPIEYFKGSFAGASGLGQFIPSSLVSFFIDLNGNPYDTDIYSMDDTISSVENYLFRHRLNGTTINDTETLYKAVFAYNRSDAYVRAVIYIYEKLRLDGK